MWPFSSLRQVTERSRNAEPEIRYLRAHLMSVGTHVPRPRTNIRTVTWICAHHVPGRLRLKLLPSRGDDAVLNAACRALLAIPAVTSVCPNFLTGSVVIHYDPLTLPLPALFEAIQQRGFLPVAANPSVVSSASFTARVADVAVGRLFEHVLEARAPAAIEAAI